MNAEYKLFDSIAKTTRMNNFYRSGSNKKILLDLSLIDNMDVSEEEKEKLRTHCIKRVCTVISDFDFYMSEIDYFHMISAKLFYKRITVISPDGCKKAYHIMRLCKIDGSEAARRDVWADYKNKKVYNLQNENSDFPEEVQLDK